MRYRLIDAFTDRPFAGNPAVVVLLDVAEWPSAQWMQSVAMEFNVSETAFARPLFSSEEADWGLRWFTPWVEDDLCGHATLATAHALAHRSGACGACSLRDSERSPDDHYRRRRRSHDGLPASQADQDVRHRGAEPGSRCRARRGLHHWWPRRLPRGAPG